MISFIIISILYIVDLLIYTRFINISLNFLTNKSHPTFKKRKKKHFPLYKHLYFITLQFFSLQKKCINASFIIFTSLQCMFVKGSRVFVCMFQMYYIVT